MKIQDNVFNNLDPISQLVQPEINEFDELIESFPSKIELSVKVKGLKPISINRAALFKITDKDGNILGVNNLVKAALINHYTHTLKGSFKYQIKDLININFLFIAEIFDIYYNKNQILKENTTTTFILKKKTQYYPVHPNIHYLFKSMSRPFTRLKDSLDLSKVNKRFYKVHKILNKLLYKNSRGRYSTLEITAIAPKDYSYIWSYVAYGHNSPIIEENSTSDFTANLNIFLDFNLFNFKSDISKISFIRNIIHYCLYGDRTSLRKVISIVSLYKRNKFVYAVF